MTPRRVRHEVTVRQHTDVETALVIECTCGGLGRLIDAEVDCGRTDGMVPIEELVRVAYDHCSGRR